MKAADETPVISATLLASVGRFVMARRAYGVSICEGPQLPLNGKVASSRNPCSQAKFLNCALPRGRAGSSRFAAARLSLSKSQRLLLAGRLIRQSRCSARGGRLRQPSWPDVCFIFPLLFRGQDIGHPQYFFPFYRLQSRKLLRHA